MKRIVTSYNQSLRNKKALTDSWVVRRLLTASEVKSKLTRAAQPLVWALED